MNAISLNEFYEKASQDPALGKKLEALSQEYEEKLRALAAGAGYALEEAIPLTDEEAQDAAGGDYRPFDKWDRSEQAEERKKRTYVPKAL